MSTEKSDRRLILEETAEATTCIAVATFVNSLLTIPLAQHGHGVWAAACGGAAVALGWASGYSMLLHFNKQD